MSFGDDFTQRRGGEVLVRQQADTTKNMCPLGGWGRVFTQRGGPDWCEHE